MIDTLYQAAIDRNLNDQIQRPSTVPAQTPSTFAGFWRGLGGIPAGAALGFGSFADINEGMAKIDASQGLVYNPGTRTYTRLPLDESSLALQRQIKTQGVGSLFTSEAGDTLRGVAKDYMPDAKTTGAATQILANGTAFLTQAGVAMGTSGPLIGAGEVGTLAGMQEADRLREQGVDQHTREQAGLAAGVGTGASMLLPMSGASALIRFGKGAAGGAASYAAQTEAEKLILQHAGYSAQASQFDPLDPVGLALSAGVPGVLGAALGHSSKLAGVVEQMESGGHRFNADGSLVTSPKGAQGEMQVMGATARDPGFGVKPAANDSPEELARVGRDYLGALREHYGSDELAMAAYNAGPGKVDAALRDHPQDWLAHLPDETQAYVQNGVRRLGAMADPDLVAAARVSQTARALESSRLTPDGDLVGMEQHQQALERASDQLGAGEPVDVSNILGDRLLPGMMESRALADHIDTLEEQRAQLLGDAGNQLEPGEASALHQQVAELQSQLQDVSATAVKERAQELQGPGVSYKQASARAQRELSARLADQQATIERLQQRLDQHAAGAQAAEKISGIERDLTAAREQQAQLPGPATTPRRLSLALQDVYRELGRTPAAERTKPNADAFHTARAEAEAAKAGEGGGPKEASAPPPREAKAPAAAPSGPADAHLEAAISQLDPNMLVHMEGLAEPMRLSDLMDSVREQAAREGKESSLLEVAAQCAISLGAGS